jgi:hypothetical protein
MFLNGRFRGLFRAIFKKTSKFFKKTLHSSQNAPLQCIFYAQNYLFAAVIEQRTARGPFSGITTRTHLLASACGTQLRTDITQQMVVGLHNF